MTEKPSPATSFEVAKSFEEWRDRHRDYIDGLPREQVAYLAWNAALAARPSVPLSDELTEIANRLNYTAMYLESHTFTTARSVDDIREMRDALNLLAARTVAPSQDGPLDKQI